MRIPVPEIVDYHEYRTLAEAYGDGARLHDQREPSNALLWIAAAFALLAIGTAAFWVWTAPTVGF